MARKALVDGLVRYDEAHGWHGAIKSIDLGQDWGVPLADIPAYGDIKPWRLAVALDVADNGDPHRPAARARQGGRGRPGPPDRDWSRSTACAGRAGRPRSLAKPGDVFYVEPIAGRAGEYRLRQIPEVSGACRRDGPVHRPRAGDGRRLLLRRIRVQPRDAGAAPARARRSSRSSTRRRSTTAIRRPRSCSTRRSRSTRATARSGRPRISRASPAARTRCASASSIRSTR